MKTVSLLRWFLALVLIALVHQPLVHAQAPTDVTINVAQFGLDGKARPGDWVGIQVDLSYSGEEATDAIIQIERLDGDGDTIEYRRHVLLQPRREGSSGRNQVWLYAWIPFRVGVNSEFKISVFDAERRQGEQEIDVDGWRIDRLLGEFTHLLTTATDPVWGMIGVVGSVAPAGLSQYEVNSPTLAPDYCATGHELTRIVDGLNTRRLPDRWMGYAPFEAIVWSGGGANLPSALNDAQAKAMREWIHRGGHLIVVIPAVGQGWFGSATNPIADLMPTADLTQETVDLRGYRTLLTRKDDRALRLDQPPSDTRDDWWKGGIVHVINAVDGAAYGDARRLMNGPDGRPVVVRRLVGRGAVTVIGIDLLNGKLRANDVVDADMFWHRILGRRHDVKSRVQLRELQDSKATITVNNRTEVWLDNFLGEAINVPGKAAAGLLLAFLVFAAYWFVAGPVGYFVLRERHKKQHAWVAFVIAAGVFTGIAWGGATLLRTTRVEGRHLTLIDHVHGQSTQVARMWTSLLLPRYGMQTVWVDNQNIDGLEMVNAISPWQNPDEVAASFPDARGYTVDAAAPNRLRVPTRATVKQFQVEWAGGTDWSMPTPVRLPGSPDADTPMIVGREIELVDRPGAKQGVIRWTVSGALKHKLPGPLQDVMVIVVERPTAVLENWIPARAVAVGLPTGDTWDPDEILDLGRLFSADIKSTDTAQEYIKRNLRPRQTREKVSQLLTAQALFPMLDPPDLTQTRGDHPLYRRRSVHAWDVGRWFTEPCIIVLGVMRDNESPVPLGVGSLDRSSARGRIKGDTMVRWIYPLPDNPSGPSAATGP